MSERDFKAALRISSKVLSATEVSHLLRTEPTALYEINTPMSKRNPESRLRDESLWLLSSPIDRTKPLNEHVESLVLFIQDKQKAFSHLASQCEADIFCGYFLQREQGGFSLNSKLIKMIAVLPIEIDLIFDIYCPIQA